MYLVSITTKHWDGYGVKSAFVTKDKDKAHKWAERFNGIIKQRQEWAAKFDANDVAKTSLMEPLWYNYVDEYPEAEVQEIKVI